MDDLVAALHLLAEKLRVNVHELSDRYVFYTQLSAIVVCVVYLLCAYVAYRVIDYIYDQYVKSDPWRLADAKAKLNKDAIKREVAIEVNEIARKATLSGVKVARVIAMALIMGSFIIASLFQISAIAFPRGAALDEVLESMKDATKVEIVQKKQSSRQPQQQEPEKDKTDPAEPR